MEYLIGKAEHAAAALKSAISKVFGTLDVEPDKISNAALAALRDGGMRGLWMNLYVRRQGASPDIRAAAGSVSLPAGSGTLPK
jgi:hypothetical protein